LVSWKLTRPLLRCLVVTVVFTLGMALPTAVLAGTCGILPFSAGSGVGRGAADNIGSLVSTEVDIRGGFELVLSADADKVADGCSNDSSCITSFGKSQGFDKVVSGSVSARGAKQYIIRVEFHEVRSGQLVRSVSRTLDRSPDSLLDEIPGMVEELLTGQRPVEEDDRGQPGAGGSSEALFDDDDINFGDDDDRAENDKPSWMARDRQGRRLRKGDQDEDPLGLDDIDDMDLDLDELSEGTQSRKRKQREEREALEAERQAEQDQLAALAAEEERKRQEERSRRETDRRAEKDRLHRVAEQRRVEEDRERTERERLDRIRTEEEHQRREEERQLADEARRRRELDEARREEARRREQQQARQNSYEDNQGEDVGFVIEDVEEDAGFVIEDAEPEDDGYSGSGDRYSRARSASRDLGGYEDDRSEASDRSYSRGGSSSQSSSSGARSSSYDDEERGTVRARANDRSLASSSDRYDDEDNLDEPDRGTVRARPVNRSRASATEQYYDEEDPDDLEPSYEAGRDGYGTTSSASASTGGGGLGRPSLAIRLGNVGYTSYYLHFFQIGLEIGIYVLPVLSIDMGFDIWTLSLLEEGENGELTRTGRGLPSFRAGASYRSNFSKWFHPYGGAEVGAVMYAQKIEGGEGGAKTPLFGMQILGKAGIDFDFIPKKTLDAGISFAVRAGVGLTGDLEKNGVPDIQEYVNSDWSPTQFIFNFGVSGFFKF